MRTQLLPSWTHQQILLLIHTDGRRSPWRQPPFFSSLSRRWFRSGSSTALRGRHFLPFFDGEVVDVSSSLPSACPFHDDDTDDTCNKIFVATHDLVNNAVFFNLERVTEPCYTTHWVRNSFLIIFDISKLKFGLSIQSLWKSSDLMKQFIFFSKNLKF